MDNLEEMGQLLKKFNLPRLNQEEIEIMNNTITSTEIEAVIEKKKKKKPPKKQKPRTRWLHRRILTFREELMPIILKPFQKIAEEGTLLNSFYEATITLISKPHKDNTHTNYRPISLIRIDAKIFNKILANRIQQHIEKLIHHYQFGFIPEMQRFFNICKSMLYTILTN